MRRFLTCFGLTLMVTAIPAMAIDSSNELAAPKLPPQSAPPVAPSPASPPATQPNSAGSGEAPKAPAQPSLRDYCREHTC